MGQKWVMMVIVVMVRNGSEWVSFVLWCKWGEWLGVGVVYQKYLQSFTINFDLFLCQIFINLFI